MFSDSCLPRAKRSREKQELTESPVRRLNGVQDVNLYHIPTRNKEKGLILQMLYFLCLNIIWLSCPVFLHRSVTIQLFVVFVGHPL